MRQRRRQPRLRWVRCPAPRACQAHTGPTPNPNPLLSCARSYMYQEGSPNWCNLYGPGMAGKCSTYPSFKTKMACENNGVCSDTTKTTEVTCGACSDGVTQNKILCENVDETWTALAWSATPGVWEEPDTTRHMWEGDSQASDHIGAPTRSNPDPVRAL